MSFNSIGVILDGDDTLWETQPFYIRAKRNFFREMVRLGFNPFEVEQRFEGIDVDNVRILGFSKKRFPKSMSDTYKALCLEHSKPIDDYVIKGVETIGYSAFIKKPRIFAGVLQTLQILRAQQLQLILATKGDYEVQEEKISNLGLRSYFHHIYTFREKGDKELEVITKECGLNPLVSWSIGNSMKSDINPALRIGMKAIWLQRRTWGFEEEEPVDRERLFKAKSIKEVFRILRSGIQGIRI